jgi:DNA-binding MarR family transcriptional regulator
MYLGVTAGLIDGHHHKRLAAAWMLFEWCIMRQTGQGEEGVICRGAVITYAEIADEMNCSAANVRKWMHRLVQQGYVRVERDRRGLRAFIKNPKKIRLSKLARSKPNESVQVQHVRPSIDGHSKPIHAVEKTGTSEKPLRSDLTKLPKNNNTTAASKPDAVSIPSLKELTRQKTPPKSKTLTREEVNRQIKTVLEKFGPGKAAHMQPQEHIA